MSSMLCPALVFLLGPAPSIIPTQEPPHVFFEVSSPKLAELRALAQADLDRRVAAILRNAGTHPASSLPFGVASAKALRGATVAFGFQVFTLRATSLYASDSVTSALEATGTWRFVVHASGKPVGLLTLAKVAGKMQVVEAGAAPLAVLLEAMEARHANPGTRLRFFRIPSAHQDFLEIQEPGSPPKFERVSPSAEPVTEAQLQGLFA